MMADQETVYPEETHVFDIFVENKPGVLARVIGQFSSRWFNIDELVVSRTQDSSVSHITIVSHGTDDVFSQIETQIGKLIDVIAIQDITHEEHVERELVLVKVKASTRKRGEILQIVEIFRARTVDVTSKSITLEITGDGEKIKAAIRMLEQYGILQLVRTGRLAMLRGDKHFEIPHREEHTYPSAENEEDPLPPA